MTHSQSVEGSDMPPHPASSRLLPYIAESGCSLNRCVQAGVCFLASNVLGHALLGAVPFEAFGSRPLAPAQAFTTGTSQCLGFGYSESEGRRCSASNGNWQIERTQTRPQGLLPLWRRHRRIFCYLAGKPP